jgi:MFS family permease
MSSWRSLLLIYFYGVASAASLSKVIPLQDEIAHLPGANAGSFALFVSLLALLPAIFGTMFGAVIDRIGTRPALIVAAALGALANGLYFYADSIKTFLAIRVFEGLIPLCVYAAAPALMISTSPPARRSAAMALWSTYTPVGTSLGLLMSASFAPTDRWHNAFVLHGALFAILVFVGWLLPQPAAEGQPPARRAAPFALLHTREGIRPVRLALTFGVLILLGLGVSVVFPTYLSRLDRMSVGTASQILAAVNVTMILGGMISGVLLTRGARVSSLFITLAVLGSIAGMGVFAPWAHIAATVAALTLWSLCTGAAMAVVASLLPRVASAEHRASAAGLLSQVGAITTFITPTIWLPTLGLNQWWGLVAIIFLGWTVGVLLLPSRSS